MDDAPRCADELGYSQGYSHTVQENIRSRKIREVIGAESEAERGPGTLPESGAGKRKARARKKQEKSRRCIIPLRQTAV